MQISIIIALTILSNYQNNLIIATNWCTDINFDTLLWSFYIAVAIMSCILFPSWSFYAKCTIININCQHNAYLESIKMSIIGKKLGKCQKAQWANFGA